MAWAHIFMAPERPPQNPRWPVRALNFLIAFFLIALVFYFSFQQLNYNWGWAPIYKYRQKFIQGWITTIWISLASLGLSTAIGLLAAAAQRSRILPLRYFSKI